MFKYYSLQNLMHLVLFSLIFNFDNRSPSLTIKTNAYHFCKLSLMKKPCACARQAEGPKHYHDMDVKDTVDAEMLNDSSGKAQESLTECSGKLKGLFRVSFKHRNSYISLG